MRLHWSRETVFAESRKYTGLGRHRFFKGCRSAYNRAWTSGWLDEMVWLEPPAPSGRRRYPPLSRELVILESKKYIGRGRWAFSKGSPRHYTYAYNHGMLAFMGWLGGDPRRFISHKSRGKWTYEDIVKESKKFAGLGRNAFKNGCRGAYMAARRLGILGDLTWLGRRSNPVLDRIYVVYKYVFPDDSTYVGITIDLPRRHSQHQRGVGGSAVFSRAKELGMSRIPCATVVAEGISQKEALLLEDGIVSDLHKGSKVCLNRGKTGECSGSVGGSITKWTKKRVFDTAVGVLGAREFRDKFPGAFDAAYRHGWLPELRQLCGWKFRIKFNTAGGQVAPVAQH